MSELDDLLKTLEGLPTGAEEKREWVDERSERLGDLMARAAGEITEFAATAYALTLVAAGDIAALDGIERIWSTFVTEVVGEYTAGMYLTGNLSAFVGVPGLGPPPEAAAAWASVVNENAVAYQAAATNRIVGASTNMWQDVRGKVTSNIQDGMSAEQTKSAIEEITGYSEFRADAIGRTEVQGAYAGGEMAGARALGEFGPTEKSWLSAVDSRTRESHLDADGQTVPIDEPFIIGGELMDRPLDPSASAAEVVNCRCVVQLLYPGDTRPDGSTVEEATEAIEPGDDAWEFSDDPAVIEERLSDLPEYETFRDTTPQRQYQEVRDGRTEFSSYEVDQVMIDIASKSGADGLPTVLSSAEFQARAAIQSSRGFGNGRAAAQFVDGAYEPGIGLKGNGYYSTQNLAEGSEYATKLGGDGKGGRIIKMGLPDDARVISINELDDQMDRLGDRVSDVFRDDPNRYALAQGYDAVRVPRVKGDWYIMLNRSRVLIDGGT